MKIIKFLLLFLLLFITTTSTFFIGVDISHTELFESLGVIYRDEQDQPKNLFALIKNNFIDTIRLPN